MGGSGATGIITGTDEGTILKAAYIKALQPTLAGMIRFFIKDTNANIALYKEIKIPVMPRADSTPVPAPQYIMYQLQVAFGIKLQAGCTLLASTQNGQSFNIIVEGSDWAYPETLPTACCTFQQETGNTSVVVVNTANSNLDGTGVTSVFTADAAKAGALVTSITIKAMGSTHEGAVRIFVSTSNSSSPTWALIQEVYIPQTTQSAYQTSFKNVINPNFWLQAGYQIGITTQNAESFAITVEAVDLVFPE